jgi:hypothetical protein
MGDLYPPSGPEFRLASTTPTTNPTGTPHEGPTSHVGRRALLAAAALVACGAATPFVLQKGSELAADEIRQLLQREIGDLEGVALEDALAVAELTRRAVELFLVPLAELLTTISGDGLQALSDTVQHAADALKALHLPSDDLDNFARLLTTWRANEAQLPVALDHLANADIDGAETYLRALKAKVNGSAPV